MTKPLIETEETEINMDPRWFIDQLICQRPFTKAMAGLLANEIIESMLEYHDARMAYLIMSFMEDVMKQAKTKSKQHVLKLMTLKESWDWKGGKVTLRQSIDYEYDHDDDYVRLKAESDRLAEARQAIIDEAMATVEDKLQAVESESLVANRELEAHKKRMQKLAEAMLPQIKEEALANHDAGTAVVNMKVIDMETGEAGISPAIMKPKAPSVVVNLAKK